MACEANLVETGIEFDSALQHSLCRLGVVTVTHKPEQRKAVYQGRDVFIWLPTGFGKCSGLRGFTVCDGP